MKSNVLPGRGRQDFMSLCLGEQREHGGEGKRGNQEHSDAYDIGAIGVQGDRKMVQEPNWHHKENYNDECDDHRYKSIDSCLGVIENIFVRRFRCGFLESIKPLSIAPVRRAWFFLRSAYLRAKDILHSLAAFGVLSKFIWGIYLKRSTMQSF